MTQQRGAIISNNIANGVSKGANSTQLGKYRAIKPNFPSVSG